MADQPSNIFNEKVSEAPTKEPTSVPQEEKQAEAVQQPSDPYADLLKTITSQDGRQKYATLSDAINSIPHAQQHISTLEQELKAERDRATALAEKLEKASKMEDVLSQVAQKEAAGKPSVEINEQQVAALIEQVMSNKERASTTKQNQQSVAQSLLQKFGDKAESVYNQKAAELGVDVNFLNDMAAKSPKAVLQFFGGVPSGQPQKTPSSSINTMALGTNSDKPRGNNPLLTGNMRDMQSAWDRIAENINKS
jgi:hypothetical protein